MEKQLVKNIKKKPKKKCEKEIERRREMKKLSMRRSRERLKNDNPEKYEEIKKRDREYKKASRKKISEMNEREKRHIMKRWRERAKTHRKKKKEIEQALLVIETPPESPALDTLDSRSFRSRVKSGNKKRRKNRKLMKEEFDKLREENKMLKRNVNKYKQRYFRLKLAKEDTSKKEVKKMLSGLQVPGVIRKNLQFGEALKKQINENFKKSVLSRKRSLVRMISGKIIKKYRFYRRISLLTSKHLLKTKIGLQKTRKFQKERIKNAIMMFLEQDDNSRLCPGKKRHGYKEKTENAEKAVIRLFKKLAQKIYHHIS